MHLVLTHEVARTLEACGIMLVLVSVGMSALTLRPEEAPGLSRVHAATARGPGRLWKFRMQHPAPELERISRLRWCVLLLLYVFVGGLGEEKVLSRGVRSVFHDEERSLRSR